MKKFTSLLLSIVMVLTMFSVVGFAVDLPVASGYVYDIQENEYYWELSEEGGVLTIKGEGDMAGLENPPAWRDFSFSELVIGEGITAIPEEAFLCAKELESVKLSATVKAIGQRGFYECEKLVNINFENIEKIDTMAFYGCLNLNEIRLPETLIELGNYSFGYYCNEALDDALAKIDGVIIIANGATVAQEYAQENGISFFDLTDYSEYFGYSFIVDAICLDSYTDCPYSDKIIIPEEIDGNIVCELDRFLFDGSNVKSVYIPASIENIAYSAFTNASELTEIICEEGSKYSTLDGVLYEDDGKTLIRVPEGKEELSELPENIEIIMGDAFRSSKITEVKIPEKVRLLAGSVFELSDIEKVNIPKNVDTIPGMCFYGCENLKEVNIEGVIETIEANAFSNCKSLENIYLPYGLKAIEGAAFHCAGLKSVVIPDSVKNIGDYAFGYYSADDIEFVKDEEFEIFGRSGTEAEEYAIENGFKFTDISPKQPEIWHAYTDKLSVTLFWEQTEDAEGYEIYRKAIGTEFKKIGEVAVDEEPVFSDVNVVNGETYTYSVVAIKGNLRSSYKQTYDIKFISLDTPELVSAQMTRKGIYVKWNTVEDAEGYILYRKTEDTEWEEIADFKGSFKSFEDTTCDSGKTYSYTVKAYNGEIESSCDYDGVTTMYLSIPKLKTASNATKGIKITWEKVKGANSYIIGRKTSSSGWVKIAEVKDVNSYIDKSAKAGTTYTYTVVSVCDDVKGFYDEDGITYKRLSKVITESATNTSSGVKITWKPVSKCTGYRVYRKTENGSWKRLATVKGSTKSYYTDKTAKSGRKYIYKVVAYSGSYTSYYTEASRYYIEVPELISAKSSKKGVTAKWEVVNGASGYYVYRKEGNGSYKKLATVKGGTKYSYLDKSAKKGRTYTYKVKAYYSKTTSAYSNTKKVTDKY